MASRWSEGGERGKTVSGLGDPERSVRGATQRTKTAGTRTGPLALGWRGPQVGRFCTSGQERARASEGECRHPRRAGARPGG